MDFLERFKAIFDDDKGGVARTRKLRPHDGGHNGGTTRGGRALQATHLSEALYLEVKSIRSRVRTNRVFEIELTVSVPCKTLLVLTVPVPHYGPHSDRISPPQNGPPPPLNYFQWPVFKNIVKVSCTGCESIKSGVFSTSTFWSYSDVFRSSGSSRPRQ